MQKEAVDLRLQMSVVSGNQKRAYTLVPDLLTKLRKPGLDPTSTTMVDLCWQFSFQLLKFNLFYLSFKNVCFRKKKNARVRAQFWFTQHTSTCCCLTDNAACVSLIVSVCAEQHLRSVKLGEKNAPSAWRRRARLVLPVTMLANDAQTLVQ